MLTTKQFERRGSDEELAFARKGIGHHSFERSTSRAIASVEIVAPLAPSFFLVERDAVPPDFDDRPASSRPS
jgi:hypothetical protein